MNDPKEDGPSSEDRRLGGPGYDLVERALRTVDRYRMIDEGESVLVAVSGGPDSTCLLDVLRRLTESLTLKLSVAHVDHGLGEHSDEVAARVSSEIAALGLEVHMIKAPELSGPNLHARARLFRYGFFSTIAEQVGATKIATGHTLDDRVETTLARLIHGSGTEGLAGIPPTDGTRIRPLLDCRRHETRAYCDQLDLKYFDDPANLDDRFERPAVRQAVVGPIADRWGDGAVRAMAASADRLYDDAQALKGLASALFGQIATRTDEVVRFDLQSLLQTPRALRRRVLELAVGRVRDRSGGIEAVVDALEGSRHSAVGRDRSYAVASGIEIEITGDHVVVRHPIDGA